MTTGPEQPHDPQQPDETAPYGATPPPPPPPPPAWGPAPAAAPGVLPPPPGPAVWGVSPAAPYGLHPMTGIPYSDKSKIVAGLLQIFIPLGIGRFYIGDTRLGVIQLLVTVLTCGIGALWPFIDGIIMLVTDSRDANGYMLRS